MRALVQRMRDELLATEDTVCLERARLVSEAYREHQDECVPLKRAKAFAHVLRHMTLDLSSNPIFAGNTSSRPRAWMLVPEHGFGIPEQVLIENQGLEGHLDGAVPDDLREFWAGRGFGGHSGIGHLAVDINRVVHEGLEALIADTEQYADEPDASRRAYRDAMRIAIQAVLHWAQRYATAAQAAARAATDPMVRAAHERVAEACRRVPARPARNLFEGLQAMALVHLATAIEGHGMSISIGLPDRVLAPFLDESFDREAATNLVGAFILKVAANSLFGRGSKTQAITVGGLDHSGEDQCNALTRCFLEAFDRVRVGDPHLFFRWHERTDPRLKERASEMLASGLSMPLLIHDVPTVQGFRDAGVAEEDAWDYCVIGCNELGIPGRSQESATPSSGSIQYLGLLNRVLSEHPDPEAIRGVPELLACLEKAMAGDALQARQRRNAARARAAENVPTPFTSALMRGCIRRGQDLLVGMDYQIPGLYERGLTNAANALAAIDHCVFRERSLTMGELLDALGSDFADRAVLERLRAAPKWGNDDDRADRWAVELVELRARVLDAVDARFGHPPHFACHVVRSLHHVDGRRIAASPDGRRAGTPVADSVGAQTGTAQAGPTATLNSVLKLRAARHYRGGYNLNLTLPAHATTPEAVLSLVEAFFGKGGQELQINVFEADALRAARERPEEHGDLVVRFAGLSARFVDLSPAEQEELIERAEAADGQETIP
ncbi:MAG: pyruvate formate lyase family protein [Candidatus Brocadiia bacterium]